MLQKESKGFEYINMFWSLLLWFLINWFIQTNKSQKLVSAQSHIELA